MGSHVIDSELFGNQFSSAEMREVFSLESMLKGWIDVEVALAKAESELGIVPEEAAQEIERKGRVERFDVPALKKGVEETWHPLVPFVREYKAMCDDGHGEYLHWGATTQDIVDTGAVLQTKQALGLIERDLLAIVASLCGMARAHAGTIMPGRTHGQHALPITFGYKVAVWISEILRHLERLDQLKPRVLTGNLSGAVGTMAFLGETGPSVQNRVMELLRLNTPEIAWHASRDRIADVAAFLAMVGATFGKIAKEIILLQKTEVAELEEPFTAGKVGSSTMPQKRNPMACEAVFATSTVLKAQVGLSFDAMLQEHERDMGLWQVEWEFLPEMFMLAGGVLHHMKDILGGLRVRDGNMAENLRRSEGLIMAEAVMGKVAERLGRQRAHDLVYQVAMQSFEKGESFGEALKNHALIKETIGASEIDALLEPSSYVGLCEHFVEAVSTSAERFLEGRGDKGA
jgi:3-carboxy-cis,cis-muconate cycloisomerase